jgi:hypothetical protein
LTRQRTCNSLRCNDLGQEGFIYFNARYYDPTTGRFITEDPSAKGTGWYTYCQNNPLTYVDPDGRREVEGESPEEDERKAREKRRRERDEDNGDVGTRRRTNVRGRVRTWEDWINAIAAGFTHFAPDEIAMALRDLDAAAIARRKKIFNEMMSSLYVEALASILGTPYTEIDCAGGVRYAIHKVTGIPLSDLADLEQNLLMKQSWTTKIEQSALMPSDLIFYDIPGTRPRSGLGDWEHVMTYVGSSVVNIARAKMAAGFIPAVDPYSKNVISTTLDSFGEYTGYISLSTNQNFMARKHPGTTYEYYRIDWVELFKAYGSK